jgi:hypothetical protein
MDRRIVSWGAGVVVLVAVAVALFLLLRGDDRRMAAVVETEEGAVLAYPPGEASADADVAIFEERLAQAAAEGWDALPFGQLIAAIGRTFVGSTYTPGVLEQPGEERLVINLRELDCVTFNENVLAIARVIRQGGGDFDDFRRELERIRYRGGRLAGYPSRLHYFSDWIADGERKGLLRDLTQELGGIPDAEPITFMTGNAGEYPALADAANVEAMRRVERELSARPRYYIPQARIAEVEHLIQDGDVIAATSSVRGLDVAHTGFAVRVDGRVHLMHAPLVGSVVEISERPLADRIPRIPGQDGIMVARPH